MTCVTEAGSLYVKKANPRERPEGSRMIVEASISPNCAMYAFNPSGEDQRSAHRFERGSRPTVRRLPVEAADEHLPGGVTAVRRGIEDAQSGQWGKITCARDRMVGQSS